MLEDGRYLMSSARFDRLCETATSASLERLGVVRVSPLFRCVFVGRAHETLDPPLRSRLQGRVVGSPPRESVLAALETHAAATVARVWSALEGATESADSLKRLDVAAPEQLSGMWPFMAAASLHNAGPASPHALVASVVGARLRKDTAELLRTVALPMDDDATGDALRRLIAHQLRAGLSVALCGPKGSGRRTLLMAVAAELRWSLELFQCYADSTPRELLQLRRGGQERTHWIDTALTRAIKNGSLCIVDGVGVRMDVLVPVLVQLLEDRETRLPDGSCVVHPERYAALLADGATPEKLTAQGVHRCHPDFRLAIVLNADDPPFPLSAPVAQYSMKSIDVAALVPQSPLAVRLAAFVKALAEPGRDKLRFSVPNIVHTALLAQSGGVTAATTIRDAMLNPFLSAATQSQLTAALKAAGLADEAQQSIASAQPATPGRRAREDEGASQKKLVFFLSLYSFLSPAHLVPHVHYQRSDSSEALLHRLAVTLGLGLPVLLCGVQGVGKNLLVDHLLARHHVARQYMQLHGDSARAIFSNVVIQDGRISVVDSPLLVGVREGHVTVLDEVDKAPPESLQALRSLVQGFVTLPDGRIVCRPEYLPLVERTHRPEDVVVISPHWRLVALSNPGVAPFQGSNVLLELGSHVVTVVAEPPSEATMVRVLQQAGDDPELIARVAAVFRVLLELSIEGKLTYAYSLREALSLVRHLRRFPEAGIMDAMENVFSFESSLKIRRLIAQVFRDTGRFDVSPDAFASPVAPLPSAGAPTITHDFENDRDFSGQQPKHGKEPDGKPHVGGATWAGGTGGSSTAGLGGKHGPYRRFDPTHQVHQLSDAAKVWSDPASKEAARALAAQFLARRLEEIRMGKADFDAYSRMLLRVQDEVRVVREAVIALRASSKRRPWLATSEGGELDDHKLVDALAGSPAVFRKRGAEPVKSTAGGKRSQIRIRFVVDCSASMYRFDFEDRRLSNMVEMLVAVMEGLDGLEAAQQHDHHVRVLFELYGHSGDTHLIPLVAADSFPASRKARFQILETIVAHTQATWSGDTTFAAVEHHIAELKTKHKDDDCLLFVVSDANFRRHGMKPAALAAMLSASQPVRAAVMLISERGGEAVWLRDALPRDAVDVCVDAKAMCHTIVRRLAAALNKRAHLD